jgi:hypothetical protein
MDFFIAFGGTGVRCLQAMLHLCAAGAGPKELWCMIIDSDDSQKNATDTKALFDKYCSVRGWIRSGNIPLFRTALHSPAEKLNWSPIPNIETGAPTFARLIRYDELSAIEKRVCNMLYSPRELAMDLTRGFRGHTAVGSASLSLIEDALSDQLQELKHAIMTELSAGRPARVYLAGSIMGGMGASGVPTMAAILRGQEWRNKDLLKLGCAHVLPYFSFQPTAGQEEALEGELYVRAQDFLVNARAALEHFAVRWDGGAKSPFDAAYMVGDNSPRSVPFAVGGPEQANQAHFVEILAALAASHFYAAADDAFAEPKVFYAGPDHTSYSSLQRHNRVSWADLPIDTRREDLRRLLLQSTVFGQLYRGFYLRLLRDARFKEEQRDIPWARAFFSHSGDRLEGFDVQEQAQALAEYYQGFYMPWLNQVHDSANVQLFSRDALTSVSLVQQITELLPGVRADATLARFPLDRIWKSMCAPRRLPEGHGLAKFCSLLYDSTSTFCSDLYQMSA